MIDEDVAKRLDILPAQSVRVLVVRRPRYGCRACEEAGISASVFWETQVV